MKYFNTHEEAFIKILQSPQSGYQPCTGLYPAEIDGSGYWGDLNSYPNISHNPDLNSQPGHQYRHWFWRRIWLENAVMRLYVQHWSTQPNIYLLCVQYCFPFCTFWGQSCHYIRNKTNTDKQIEACVSHIITHPARKEHTHATLNQNRWWTHISYKRYSRDQCSLFIKAGKSWEGPSQIPPNAKKKCAVDMTVTVCLRKFCQKRLFGNFQPKPVLAPSGQHIFHQVVFQSVLIIFHPLIWLTWKK